MRQGGLAIMFRVAVVACFLSPTSALLPAAAAAAQLAAAGAAAHTAAAAAAAHAAAAVTGAAGAHTGAVGIGVHAATQAIAVNTASAVAVGATGAAVSAPNAITTAMQRSKRPQLQAIGRIIQVELERLKAAALGGGKPAVVVQRVHSTAVSRAPIIKWGLDIWMRSTLEQQAKVSERLARQRDHQGKTRLLPWQKVVHYGYTNATHGRVPDIVTSLRELQVELSEQIKFGFRTSPLSVIRLAYCSLLVTICALVARYPGFEALRRGVTTRWPRLVIHLAATLEENLAATRRLIESSGTTLTLRLPDEHGVLAEIKNTVEAVTGLDIDGDGVVGKPPSSGGGTLTLQVRDRDGGIEKMKNIFESFTGLDIDGDGHVGTPPPTPQARRTGGMRGLLTRAFGAGRVRKASVAVRAAPRMQLQDALGSSRDPYS